MKILFPCELFYPAKLGGPANTIYWLAKALQRNGMDVSVVTTDRYIDDTSVQTNCWTRIDGIRVRYCHTIGKFSLKVVYYACSELNKSDVIIFSSICYLPNFPIFLKALLKRKKIIWSPRGELFGSAVQGNRWKISYFQLLNFLSCGRILFHATSQDEKQSIQQIFGQTTKVVTIPNYMELPRRCKRCEQKDKYLLYVGRIAPIKAIDNLIRALAVSSFWKDSGYHLRLVGDVQDQFKDYYQKLLCLIEEYGLQNSVRFVGPLHGTEKYQSYANAQYLFLVSNSENFGNVVIESLSQGTPVVASKGTPWCKLEETGSGYWIENTPDIIAKCIDEIIKMPSIEYECTRKRALEFSKSFDVFDNVGEWELVLSR